MAVVTLGTTGAARPVQRVAAKWKAAAAVMRTVADSYVNYRMQTSASQAEHFREPRTAKPTAFASDSVQPEPPTTMHIEDETERALQPLDPGTISDVIPAFFVGRNHDGLWVVREATGAVGGMFLFKDSATSFARRHSGSTGCATIFPAERFELNIANSGNPLAAFIGQLLRLARRMWRSVTASSDTVQRR
jgi:hypothetical protein